MNSIPTETWQERVAALDADGRADDALSVLRRAAFEHPDDADIGYHVGERLQKSGRLDEAAVVFALVSTIGDDHMRFRALLGRAECLRQLGNFTDALSDIDRAMLIDPGSHWPVIAMAEVYSSAGRDSERLNLLNQFYDVLRPDARAEVARYASGMQAYWHFEGKRTVPGWGAAAPTRIMGLSKAGMMLLVKDEEDIIGQNLRHHYDLGFRVFCILNNLSTDRTRVIIDEFKMSKLDSFVIIVDDPVAGHYQADKMNIYSNTLVKHARLSKFEIDWIFYVDADEFIAFDNSYLSSQKIYNFEKDLLDRSIKFLVFHWIHCASFHMIEKLDNNLSPFLVLNNYSSRLIPVVPKIACRVDSDFEIMEGNHFIKYNIYPLSAVKVCALDDLYMWHFSLRSSEQVRKKIINGGRAFEGTVGLEAHGDHWRDRYALFQKYGETIISQVLQNHINSISCTNTQESNNTANEFI